MDELDYLEFDSWSSSPIEKPGRAPASRQTPTERGRTCRQRGDFYEAAKWFGSAVDKNDHDFSGRVLKVDSLVRAQMIDEANTVSAAHLERFPRVRELYGSRALVLGHLGQFQEAQQRCAVALEGQKASSYAQCVRGELVLLEDSRNFGIAMGWYERALDLSGDRWEVHAVPGMALLHADLPMLAASYFAEACHASPRAAYSLIGLGDCFAQLRLYDQALFYYRQVLLAEPGNAQALEREKRYAGGIYGLMNALHRPNLMKRWNDAYQKLLKRR